LELLWLTEILNSAEHHKLIGFQKLWVVAGMVCLDIIRCEPWMLQARISLNSARWVLLKHLANQVFAGI